MRTVQFFVANIYNYVYRQTLVDMKSNAFYIF